MEMGCMVDMGWYRMEWNGVLMFGVGVIRTMVYVEGDAQMRQYDDSEGKRQSALSIVQRP